MQVTLSALYDTFDLSVRAALHNTPARFVRGDGPAPAPLMFVGEAPGLDEDRQGRPFIGRAGRLLTQWLDTVGLRREEVFITNVVKCHPMKNPATPEARSNDRPPTPEEIRLCLPVLCQEILLVRPLAIVSLGSPSSRTLLATRDTITQLHGRFHPLPARRLFADQTPQPSEEDYRALESMRVFPLFHPAATFHNPPLSKDVAKDLAVLKEALLSIAK